MKKGFLVLVLVTLMVFVMAMTAQAENYTTPNGDCALCHIDGGKHNVLVGNWKNSLHPTYDPTANNTYCAKCHSPLQADPIATSTSNQLIATENWEGVTCYVCHTPRIKDPITGQALLGHQLGNYKVGTGAPSGLNSLATTLGQYDFVNDPTTGAQLKSLNDFCKNCHKDRHLPTFGRTGQNMLNKGVTCVDCHMPKITRTYTMADGTQKTLTFRSHDLKVSANLPESCLSSGCHSNKSLTWAQSNISKGIPHSR